MCGVKSNSNQCETSCSRDIQQGQNKPNQINDWTCVFVAVDAPDDRACVFDVADAPDDRFDATMAFALNCD